MRNNQEIPMAFRPLVLLGLSGAALAGCSTVRLPPTEVVRYHLGAPIARGTVGVEPLTGNGAPASLEFKSYAAAVEGQMLQNGYTLAPAGTKPQFVATVDFQRTQQAGPPRRSPISIGLGAGGFSGGGYRGGGGVGLGGGVGFPIGGGRGHDVLVAQLSVQIKRSVDQSPVWEGKAQGVSDISAADDQAGKLAAALFTGFPGESGRTITVK